MDHTPDDIAVTECKIIKVNPDTYTIDLVTDGPNTLHAFDVPWPVPYRHLQGGGIDFIPEVGATCWVLWHPEDSLPVILGFSSQYSPISNWKSGRPKMAPGDIVLWTQDHNRVFVRRGGDVEIVSTPENKRLFIAATHTIEELCRAYKLTTRGGELSWTTDVTALNAATGSPSLFKLQAKRYAQDGEPVATIEMGDIPAEPGKTSLLLKLEVVGKFKLTVDTQGEVLIGVNQKLGIYASQGVEFTSDLEFTVSAKTGITFKSTAGNLTQSFPAGVHSLEAISSTETLSGQKHISAASILLGKAPVEPAVLGQQLMIWLASHSHPQIGAPPVQIPTLATIISKTVKVG